MKHFTAAALALCLMTAQFAHAQNVSGCGALENHYGPYDYRKEKGRRLNIVEGAHFTPAVEALIRGSSGAFAGDDLNYTLLTSPNHHRALLAMVRLADRAKSSKPPHMQYTVDCFFDRAVRFQPDDTVVRALYGRYLNRQGRTAEAMQQLKAAVIFAKDNPLSHYNLGLVFMELKAYDEALAQAHTAIALGMPPGALVDQLKAQRRWQEAARAPSAAASAASAAP